MNSPNSGSTFVHRSTSAAVSAVHIVGMAEAYAMSHFVRHHGSDIIDVGSTCAGTIPIRVHADAAIRRTAVAWEACGTQGVAHLVVSFHGNVLA